MKAKKSSKKILIILGLIILGLFVAIYFLFVDIKHRNEHISVLSQSLASNVNKQDTIILLRKMIANSNSDITHVSNSIIQSDGDVDFIENLERIAKDNGLSVDIKSLTFENSPGISTSTATVFKISAEVDGDWAGTYKFLASMESLPIKIKVNKINTVSDTPGLWASTFEIIALKYK